MQTSGVENNKRVSYFQYDFAKHGGAVSAITVTGDGIPSGAVITDGMIHVNTACVGSGASVAIMAVGANDILSALAITSLTLNDLVSCVPKSTQATWIRLTAALNSLTFTISAAALTAGKITVALEWVLAE